VDAPAPAEVAHGGAVRLCIPEPVSW